VFATAPGAVSPPKASPAVCVPAPPKAPLAVFNPVGLLVQEVPSYFSVAVE